MSQRSEKKRFTFIPSQQEKIPESTVKPRSQFFLRRILAVLMTSLVLWTLLTGLLYNYIARPVFIKIKQKDIVPQASYLAGILSSEHADKLTEVNYLIDLYYSFFGSSTYLVSLDESINTTLKPNDKLIPLENLRNDILLLHRDSIANNEVTYLVNSPPNQKGELLYISVPITSKNQDKLIGTVVIVQPLNEFNAGIRSLNLALFISAVIVGILLFIPSTIFTINLVRPLNNIRQIAMSMSHGDFSQVADEQGENEIGDLGRAINILARKLSQTISQLTHEKKQLKEIIDSMAEGIVATNSSGEVTLVNHMVWRLFHRNPELYNSQKLIKLLGIDKLFATCLQENRTVSGNFDADSSTIYYLITPLRDEKNNNTGAVGLFRDITESVRLEQTRRDYVANVSHELRTPITAMRGLLEPLNDDMVADEKTRKRYYNILLRESIRLSRLIDDMLELSRLQSGRNLVHQQPFDLQEILNDLAIRWEMQASEQERHFTYIDPPQHIPPVWGNADRVEQILFILFDNALKFTQAGIGKIELTCENGEGYCKIKVTDNGEGIKARDLPYVFDRFYKADKSHNQRGTGLGLSIARELADLMGMQIAVASAPGEGSAFSLKLPYAEKIMQDDQYIKDAKDATEIEVEE